MKSMRAKMTVDEVKLTSYSDEVIFKALYAGDKNAEDNTYSKATPSATFNMSITNPALRGVYKPGQKFYVDFTPIDDTPPQ